MSNPLQDKENTCLQVELRTIFANGHDNAKVRVAAWEAQDCLRNAIVLLHQAKGFLDKGQGALANAKVTNALLYLSTGDETYVPPFHDRENDEKA